MNRHAQWNKRQAMREEARRREAVRVLGWSCTEHGYHPDNRIDVCVACPGAPYRMELVTRPVIS